MFLPAGLPARRSLLFLGSPTAVFFAVPFVVIDSVYRHSFRPFPHVFHESTKTLKPTSADGNATSSIVLILRVTLSAPLDHLPPARVRRSETFAKQRLAATYFLLRVVADASAALAGGKPPGLLRRRIFFPPYKYSADDFHYHLATVARHRLTTGTPTTCRVSAAKVCPPD